MTRFTLRQFPAVLAVCAAFLTTSTLRAQDAAQVGQGTAAAPVQGTESAIPGKPVQETKKQVKKDNRVVPSKDTKKVTKKEKKANPLAGMDEKLPDKQLFDKAMLALQKNRFDVARLDLQTLLNTYPDSQYQMRAKLAIGDSWYKEGGTAALTQAEQEYKDFITFFPNQPEAAEAQMKVANIYFREMDRPDRDYTKALRAQEEYRNMIQQFPESQLIPEAKQKLRDVQEVLGLREENIANFYQ
jgi:outer membrane protein assembly factor BamD